MNNIQGMTSDTQTEGKQCLKLYLHKCVATDVKKFIWYVII